jgi:hypothetical protein
MIHIKYSIFKNEQNLDSNEIQVSNHKENTFKTIYQIINQKIIKKQTINLEQLVIFCSFKIIKKIKNKTNYEETQKESNEQFLKNKDCVNNFKNFKTMTIEIMVDNLPKNIIRFSA